MPKSKPLPIEKKSPMNEQDYISKRLQPQIDAFSAKGIWHKKRHRFYKRLELVIGISVPVLIILSFVLRPFSTLFTSEFAQTLAIVGGVVLVLIIKKQEIENHQEFWLKYQKSASRLKRELDLYQTGETPYQNENALVKLVSNTETILNKEGLMGQ